MKSEKSNGHGEAGETLPQVGSRTFSDAPSSHGGGGHGGIWLIVLVGLGIGGYFVFPLFMALFKKNAATDATANRPVPVVAAHVRRGNLDIYLTGLGMAQALNAVTLHTRVDGQLNNVSFVEGQTVQAGKQL